MAQVFGHQTKGSGEHASAQKPRVLFSRRAFFRATCATAASSALACIAVSAGGCKHRAVDDPQSPVVVDDAQAEYIIDPQTNESKYSAVDFELKQTGNWELPLGNMLYPSDGVWIAATTAGTSATPAIKASAFNTKTGQLVQVLEQPYGKSSTNCIIYDVRTSDKVFVWLEFDIVTRDWTLYASAFADGKLHGQVSELWKADADYLPAQFCVHENYVVWQVSPSPQGSRAKENSYCYLWKLGDDKASSVVESLSRFACAPTFSKGSVVIVPKVKTKSAPLYVMRVYSLTDSMEKQQDELFLPPSVAPLYATYINSLFAFSIEANHQSGGLLGKMGTYIGSRDKGFVVVPREPSAPVVGNNNTFIVRSKASYFVVDTAQKSYSILAASNRCTNYGEYPACTGEQNSVVTYATIKDKTTGYPKNVLVRQFRV